VLGKWAAPVDGGGWGGESKVKHDKGPRAARLAPLVLAAAVVAASGAAAQEGPAVVIDGGDVSRSHDLVLNADGGVATAGGAGGDENVAAPAAPVAADGGGAAAGNGGDGVAAADGGAIAPAPAAVDEPAAGPIAVDTGGNAGNAVGVGDSTGGAGGVAVSVVGPTIDQTTEITLDASGGSAVADASGGDGNLAAVARVPMDEDVAGGLAAVGNGGSAAADASGGALTVGPLLLGGNAGGSITVGDIGGSGGEARIAIDGGTVTGRTRIAVDAAGGTAIAAAGGGDDNLAAVERLEPRPGDERDEPARLGELTLAAGNGGNAAVDAGGGDVALGAVLAGRSVGHVIALGDVAAGTGGAIVRIDGGDATTATDLAIAAGGGTGLLDAAGGDGNAATAGLGFGRDNFDLRVDQDNVSSITGGGAGNEVDQDNRIDVRGGEPPETVLTGDITAGNGGAGAVDASGGDVRLGDVTGGANAGNVILLGDVSGGGGGALVEAGGGQSMVATALAIDAAGGTGIGDVSGGDDNTAAAELSPASLVAVRIDQRNVAAIDSGGPGGGRNLIDQLNRADVDLRDASFTADVELAAGNGGAAAVDAAGGGVAVGDVSGGGNLGNVLLADDVTGGGHAATTLRLDGGSTSRDTRLAVAAGGGTGLVDASGGDDNAVAATLRANLTVDIEQLNRAEIDGNRGGTAIDQRNVAVIDNPQIVQAVELAAGNGGSGAAAAGGGTVVVGDVTGGGNLGNLVRVGDVASGASVRLDGGEAATETGLALGAAGGAAVIDGGGGDDNLAGFTLTEFEIGVDQRNTATVDGGPGERIVQRNGVVIDQLAPAVAILAGNGGGAVGAAAGGALAVGDVAAGANVGNVVAVGDVAGLDVHGGAGDGAARVRATG